MSLHSMLDSVCTIFRPTSVSRDANQGTVQNFTVLQPAMACSQQQMGASKQLLYRQDNAFVGTTLYFDENPGTTADDKITATSDFDQSVTYYIVSGRGSPVQQGVIWNVDCTEIQASEGPAAVVLPTATSITTTTATLGGSIASDGDGDITESGVVYSVTATNGYPIIGGSGVSQDDSGPLTIGSFGLPITGLTADTRYSFRPYATNGVGTTYGTVTEFVTEAA